MAASWTRENVKAIAPEFEGVTDDVIDGFIVIADRLIADQNWGDRGVDAGSYLTAHLMVVSGIKDPASTGGGGGGSGVTGAVQSVRVGEVAVTYSSATAGVSGGGASANAGWFSLSRYGMTYSYLISVGLFGFLVP